MRRFVAGSLMAGLGILSGAAFAAGSGGGASMPSASAPQYDPAAEYQKGIAALQASQYAEARKAFDKVLAVAPQDPNSAYLAGMAAEGLDKPKDARRYYQRAIKSDKTHIEAHRALGLVLVKLGEKDKAQEELAAIKAAGAECAGTCAKAGAIEAAAHDVEAALAGQAVSRADPLPAGGAAGDVVYADAVALINQHRYDAALASLQRAGANFGPHPDVLTYMGFTNRKMGQLDRAEYYYKQALSIAPDHRGALEYYGELKVERGDIAGARANLAKLESICRFGCYEAEELRLWIDTGHQPAA